MPPVFAVETLLKLTCKSTLSPLGFPIVTEHLNQPFPAFCIAFEGVSGVFKLAVLDTTPVCRSNITAYRLSADAGSTCNLICKYLRPFSFA